MLIRDISEEPPAGGSNAAGRDYANWSVESDEHADASYVGTAEGGTPIYHGEGRVFHGNPDGESRAITPIPDSERQLEPGETVADVIEEIGDSLGWERLSEFGEEHSSGESR